MNAATEACTEAWKFQYSEWLHGADKATVAIARSWFSAGWTAGVVWQVGRPATDTATTEYHDSVVGEAQRQIHALEAETERLRGLVGIRYRALQAAHRETIAVQAKITAIQAIQNETESDPEHDDAFWAEWYQDKSERIDKVLWPRDTAERDNA